MRKIRNRLEPSRTNSLTSIVKLGSHSHHFELVTRNSYFKAIFLSVLCNLLAQGWFCSSQEAHAARHPAPVSVRVEQMLLHAKEATLLPKEEKGGNVNSKWWRTSQKCTNPTLHESGEVGNAYTDTLNSKKEVNFSLCVHISKSLGRRRGCIQNAIQIFSTCFILSFTSS